MTTRDDDVMTSLTDPGAPALIGAATALIFDIHRDHYRKSAAESDPRIPYTTHLLGVAGLVIESPAVSAEHVAAALLHDSVEDRPSEVGITARLWQDGRAAVQTQLAHWLAPHLGSASDRVAELVMYATEDRAVTLSVDADEEEISTDSLRRKRAYRMALASETFDQCLVSVADNLYNARSIVNDVRLVGPTVWQRFNTSPTDKVEHYVALEELFRGKDPTDPLVRQFGLVVRELLELPRA